MKRLWIEILVVTAALWMLNGFDAVLAAVLLVVTCLPVGLLTGLGIGIYKKNRRRHNG